MIDIIIPVFNRAHLIVETLNSIQNQTFTEWNCYVIDDHSEDEIEEVVAEFVLKDSRFKFFKRPADRKKGANACRNYGFELSSSPFIYWFDSDDLLRPNALETYLNAFDKNTDVVIAPVDKTMLGSGVFIERNTIQSDNLVDDYFNYKVIYFVCGPMWKREFLSQQKELFDEDLGHHDEWDFNLRMIYQNPNKILLHEPLVIYRQHESSFKNEIPKGNIAEIESAFKARFKHLNIISRSEPRNRKKIAIYIAHQYKKTTRNLLLGSNQKYWFRYYRKGVILYIKTAAFWSALKFSMGVVLLKIFKKGYRFFD